MSIKVRIIKLERARGFEAFDGKAIIIDVPFGEPESVTAARVVELLGRPPRADDQVVEVIEPAPGDSLD